MPATHRFLPFLPPNQQHQSTERKKNEKWLQQRLEIKTETESTETVE